MKKDTITVRSLLKSFQYSFSGLKIFLNTEPNARIHLASTFVVLALCFLVRLSAIEIIILLLSITLVWVTELFNTCIERSMDKMSEEFDIRIKAIKDMASGAVVLAALFALIAALIIFLPKVF